MQGLDFCEWVIDFRRLNYLLFDLLEPPNILAIQYYQKKKYRKPLRLFLRWLLIQLKDCYACTIGPVKW